MVSFVLLLNGFVSSQLGGIEVCEQKDRKFLPILGTNQVARFAEFHPLTSLGRILLFIFWYFNVGKLPGNVSFVFARHLLCRHKTFPPFVFPCPHLVWSTVYKCLNEEWYQFGYAIWSKRFHGERRDIGGFDTQLLAIIYTLMLKIPVIKVDN